MDEPPSIAADLLPLDVVAWQRVLTGLTILRFVAIVLPLSVPFLACLVPFGLALSRGAQHVLGPLFGVAVVSFYVIMVVALFIGALLCCDAPIDWRARRSAMLAIVFAAIFMLGLGIAFVLLRLASWAPFLAMPVQRLLVDVDWILILMLITVFIVAVACWFRFLQGVAESLHAPKQAANIQNFIWFFSTLSILGGLPILLLWGLALLLDTRKLLHDTLERERMKFQDFGAE